MELCKCNKMGKRQMVGMINLWVQSLQKLQFGNNKKLQTDQAQHLKDKKVKINTQHNNYR